MCFIISLRADDRVLVQIRDGEAAAAAKEAKKQDEARQAEQKRQSKDQEKLKKLDKEYARSVMSLPIPSKEDLQSL